MAEVITETKSLPSKTAASFNELSVKLIQLLILSIAAPLTHIINCSFKTGNVPDDLKIAKVIPIHKRGDKSFLIYYRPILILHALSKIIERIMYIRLVSFFNKYKILSQFGLRMGRSREHAFIQLTDYLILL